MKAQPEMHWSNFFKVFSDQNRNRPTRIAVFKGIPGDMDDYWLEDGMPLAGIDLDPTGEDGLEVQIFTQRGADHMTRRVRGVRFARITLSTDGEADGLELGTQEGESTVLRFESAKEVFSSA